uniref:Uncharacterized protein n=1 Tax=Anopheles gambiae TaxID=7165 RepID=A0A0E4GBN8_ANOGA
MESSCVRERKGTRTRGRHRDQAHLAFAASSQRPSRWHRSPCLRDTANGLGRHRRQHRDPRLPSHHWRPHGQPSTHSRRQGRSSGCSPSNASSTTGEAAFRLAAGTFGWASHPPMLQPQVSRVRTHSTQLQQQQCKDPSATSNTARLELSTSSARHKFRRGSSPV